MSKPTEAYRPRKPPGELRLELRGLECHVRVWGEPDAPLLLLLHGAFDASPTFQFLVDALERSWRVLAPDWRGYGRSAWAPQGYWFPDYLADLDAFLEQVSPGLPVPLVGHSLGGNVACTYAGLRPERVSHLVSLDGFGLPDRDPAEAPAHLRRWLESWRAPPPRRPVALRTYPDHESMADRLRTANPRLPADKALYLAAELSRPVPGGLTWSHDPGHRRPFATLHRRAEWEAAIRAIRAPTLWIGSGGVVPPGLAEEPGGLDARRALVPQSRFVPIPDTSHNLHHDAPATVAREIERFLESESDEGREAAQPGHARPGTFSGAAGP